MDFPQIREGRKPAVPASALQRADIPHGRKQEVLLQEDHRKNFPSAMPVVLLLLLLQEYSLPCPRKLAAYPGDLSGYDTVWLVAPVWHYTLCTPLRMFLESTDLSGKTVYVVTTHRGSGFADVPERVQEMEPGAQVIAALAIPGNDAPKHRDEVLDYVINNMK